MDIQAEHTESPDRIGAILVELDMGSDLPLFAESVARELLAALEESGVEADLTVLTGLEVTLPSMRRMPYVLVVQATEMTLVTSGFDGPALPTEVTYEAAVYRVESDTVIWRARIQVDANSALAFGQRDATTLVRLIVGALAEDGLIAP